MPWYRCRIRQMCVTEVELPAPDEETVRQRAAVPLEKVPGNLELERLLEVEVTDIERGQATRGHR